MHVFFEDDGQLKAGTILADNDSSLQVEAATGKRLKIKAAAVLLRYAEPSPSALIADAQGQARELDPNFLWEVSGDDEFGFADLAHEYFGHAPLPVEAAAVAMTLASAPMFFYILHLYVLLVLQRIAVATLGANHGERWGVDDVYWIWLGAVVLATLLYFPTRAFGRYKRRTTLGWVKYF